MEINVKTKAIVKAAAVMQAICRGDDHHSCPQTLLLI
jgi:hypothetical protein